MSVHIDELHTDVTLAPAVGQGGGPDVGTGGGGGEPGEALEEAWRRAKYLARRVAAVDFDD
jgi:hypothetical protein